MKWMTIILALLAFSVWRTASAKAPRVLMLSESEVATVNTAPGYTTMLQFDSRPTSVIVGDQDAFKVEHAGTGLAIKPLVPHAKTNLFVFTDYDRFNFRLVAGAAADVEYLLKISKKGDRAYPVESAAPPAQSDGTRLIQRRIGKKASCGGLTLGVQALAWPESGSTLLIEFRAEAAPTLVDGKELRFEPGDFDVRQAGRSVPVESLYLNRLGFTREAPVIEGTIVLRQAALSAGTPLQLSFSPDAVKAGRPRCVTVFFSRSAPAKIPTKSSKP